MTDVSRHQAGERHTALRAVLYPGGRKRGRREERSASGILHDVGQEPPRAAGRAVLVVDVAVDVALIGVRNQPGRVVLPVLLPERNRNTRQIARRKTFDAGQRRLQEAARIGVEALGKRHRASERRAQHHELRLHAPHSGRAPHCIEHGLDQRVLVLHRPLRGPDVKVSN